MNRNDASLDARMAEALSRAENALGGEGFVEPGDVDSILDGDGDLRKDADACRKRVLFRLGLADRGFKDRVRAYLDRCASLEDDIAVHNRRVAEMLSADVGRMINPVEGRDLDMQQLASIATDVRTRLVLAGAGTGKTTMIVGLVKHLIMSGRADSEEILVLSFTNASVDELAERIRAETGRRVEASTFHRLGMKAIAAAEGRVPKVCSTGIRDFIKEEIRRRRSDEGFMRRLNDYLVFGSGDRADESSFGSRSAYVRYLMENPLITLNGERVKSFGEAEIADWLAINGVPYRYEESYREDTNDSEYGQYHPDFHLAGTDIYIEYFGIDRSGSVNPSMVDRNPDASEEYRKGIEWKRGIHKANGSILLELYAYNRSEGDLVDILEQKLKEQGVELHPASPSAVFDEIRRRNAPGLRAAVSSLATIILLVESTGKRWDEAYPKGGALSDRISLRRTESIAKPMYEAYRRRLEEENEIDFEDMLNLAARHVRNGEFHHGYRYVIVDEYQDISRSRFNLLKAMRDDRDFRLCCVGDDWQSIYRFNGSDTSYILGFRKYWGPSAVSAIETTYRFGGDILRMSSEFICRNGRQHRKDLRCPSERECRVVPVTASSDQGIRAAIGEVLIGLPDSVSVLFLGRYNHDVCLLEGDGFSWSQRVGGDVPVSYSPRRDLSMRFMTIHGSKGLQADYVFSINNRSGRDGFPACRTELPAVRLLMDGGDSEMDEERRLFYVAMTRARRDVFIAAPDDRRSMFFRELFGDGAGCGEEMFCPICGGRLVSRKGRYGEFMGCENYCSAGCRFTRRIGGDRRRRPRSDIACAQRDRESASAGELRHRLLELGRAVRRDVQHYPDVGAVLEFGRSGEQGIHDLHEPVAVLVGDGHRERGAQPDLSDLAEIHGRSGGSRIRMDQPSAPQERASEVSDHDHRDIGEVAGADHAEDRSSGGVRRLSVIAEPLDVRGSPEDRGVAVVGGDRELGPDAFEERSQRGLIGYGCGHADEAGAFDDGLAGPPLLHGDVIRTRHAPPFRPGI